MLLLPKVSVLRQCSPTVIFDPYTLSLLLSVTDKVGSDTVGERKLGSQCLFIACVFLSRSNVSVESRF